MLFLPIFLFASVALCYHKFHLQVVDASGKRAYNVTSYEKYGFLVSHLDYRNDSTSPVSDPLTFYLNARDGTLNTVETQEFVALDQLQTNQLNEDVLELNKSQFAEFHETGGYLTHGGDDKFYSCNAYVLDKYVSFLSTNGSCFLAEEVKLWIKWIDA